MREVKSSEITELQKIGRKTFSETFSSTNTPADMTEYLDHAFDDVVIKKEIAHVNSCFYFAVAEDKTVGYLKVNWKDGQTDIKSSNALEIERIYVLKDFLGFKVGQLLFERALHIAKEKKVDFIWLGVWEHNERAIRFYEKNDFHPFDKHPFYLGKDRQIDIMMKRFL